MEARTDVVLAAVDVRKRFGALAVLDGVNLERHAPHGLQQAVAAVERVDLEQRHAPAPPRYASITAAWDTTTSGLPSAIILPASMQTRRPTTCIRT